MNNSRNHSDVLIIGGGVIGLSIAYELSGRGINVTLLERGAIGTKASWAGAGILPPANHDTALHPIESLAALSRDTHAVWARQLLAETGIDNGYWECGSVHLARSAGDIAALAGAAEEYRSHEINFDEWGADKINKQLPSIAKLPENKRPRNAIWLHDEAQVRNPDHLAALTEGCRLRNVQLVTELESLTLSIADPHRERKHPSVIAQNDDELFSADALCVAAGPWSEELLSPLGFPLPSIPIRGQVLLYKLERPPFDCVVYEGSRYFVPRRDGYVLVGTTIEEAGFDESTTPEAVAELSRFANELFPELNQQSLIKSWAGLRPGTFDGFPFLGKISTFENLFVATGHFKAGLTLSTGTALVMADLVQRLEPTVDLSVFDPNRAAQSHSTANNTT